MIAMEEEGRAELTMLFLVLEPHHNLKSSPPHQYTQLVQHIVSLKHKKWQHWVREKMYSPSVTVYSFWVGR
jgi:hypothetical protein